MNKFDLSYDVKFSTYAVPMIIGEIKRFLRDDGIIKVSRSLKQISMRARIAQEKLSKVLGREPTIQEIACEISVDKEEIVEALILHINRNISMILYMKKMAHLCI